MLFSKPNYHSHSCIEGYMKVGIHAFMRTLLPKPRVIPAEDHPEPLKFAPDGSMSGPVEEDGQENVEDGERQDNLMWVMKATIS